MTVSQSRRVWMTWGRTFKKQGAALMHQQCGLWGYDVRREVGGVRSNALLELGFERTPPPQGVLGATTYQRREPNGLSVTLWGFGMRFGDEHGGIFLSRFAFSPLYCGSATQPHIWEPAPLLETHYAPHRAHECLAALDYFCGAMLWIAGYEREIEARFGASYRADALHAWAKSPPVNMAQQWERVAVACRDEVRFWQREKRRNCRIILPVDCLQCSGKQ